MASPKITASLVKSLQNCSLNHQQNSINGSDSLDNYSSLELNSQIPLPHHWEQCLDLKSGEIYFINWATGMKSTEDPRTTAEYGGDYWYSEDYNSAYDSEGSYSESSSSQENNSMKDKLDNKNNSASDNDNNSVLVVAGCKRCLMYYMVPKQHEICPKCCGQLMHFD